ncbi:MAG: heparin lyase I family protein, partial [Thermosphaera sp.]
MVSKTSNRSNAVELEASSVAGKIYVFMVCEGRPRRVDFYLNDPERRGPPYQREYSAFYDFAGTASDGEAKAFDTTALADRLHTITAAIVLPTDDIEIRHATFLVDNGKTILWSADHETGDLSQWTQNQGEAVFNTGTGQVQVTDAVARSGRYALELKIRKAEGQAQAARIFRWHENPKSAYYSAWLFFPRRYEPAEWWNIFQFKSVSSGRSEPMWSLNVGTLANGDMFIYLWDALRRRSFSTQLPSAPIPIPTKQWTHIEVFYQRATDRTGQIIVWQDGVKLYDIAGVQTALSNEVQWSLNN